MSKAKIDINTGGETVTINSFEEFKEIARKIVSDWRKSTLYNELGENEITHIIENLSGEIIARVKEKDGKIKATGQATVETDGKDLETVKAEIKKSLAEHGFIFLDQD